MKIQRCVARGAVLALILGVAASAGAVPIDFRIASVDVMAHTDVSTALAIRINNGGDPLDGSVFSLDSGESAVVDLFRIGTPEDSIDGDDDFARFLMAEIQFDMPVPATGVAVGFTWGNASEDAGFLMGGTSAIEVNGVQLKTQLLSTLFPAPGDVVVQAEFTRMDGEAGGGAPGGPGPSVPEPGAAILFGVGTALLSRRTMRRAEA